MANLQDNSKSNMAAIVNKVYLHILIGGQFVKNFVRADLHGTIFVACDNCLRQAHDIVHDCCVRQEKCRSILKHVLKRYDNPKSCLRPVVSLSHATKSHRVNRPLGGHGKVNHVVGLS